MGTIQKTATTWLKLTLFLLTTPASFGGKHLENCLVLYCHQVNGSKKMNMRLLFVLITVDKCYSAEVLNKILKLSYSDGENSTSSNYVKGGTGWQQSLHQALRQQQQQRSFFYQVI